MGHLNSSASEASYDAIRAINNVGSFCEMSKICICGRTVFMGYVNMEDETKKILDSDGWLHSGDLGRKDGDGFIYVTGRLKG